MKFGKGDLLKHIDHYDEDNWPIFESTDTRRGKRDLIITVEQWGYCDPKMQRVHINNKCYPVASLVKVG